MGKTTESDIMLLIDAMQDVIGKSSKLKEACRNYTAVLEKLIPR